jgi:hypothetical protein
MTKQRRFLLFSALAIGLTGGMGTAAQAQQAGAQAVTGGGSYVYDVPSAWQIDSSPGATGSLAASPDGSELAYVSVVNVPASSMQAEGSGAEVLHDLTQASITQESARSGYTLVQAATPANVPSADAAEKGEISYTTADGSVIDEYVLTALSGLNGYTLVVSLPAVPGAADAAASILSSFTLTPSGQSLLDDSIRT